MPLKMVRLILGIKRYGGTDQIDVTVNVHIQVSHAKECDVILLKITSYTLT
jgi:hypothetical protein